MPLDPSWSDCRNAGIDGGTYGCILDIDLDAIAANWRLLRDRVFPAECAAVVKADAYGLGATPVARALHRAGCRTFFVALPDEGSVVREAVGEEPVIGVLNGYPNKTNIIYKNKNLSPVLNSISELDSWICGQHAPQVNPFVHIDTGINRLGLAPADWQGFCDRLPTLNLAGVLSHLACADEPDHAQNEQQLAVLRDAMTRLPGSTLVSFANSSGIFLGPEYHFQMVRPGAALYGVNPTPGRTNPMQPVVRLHGRILQVRQIDQGQTVGYGATYSAHATRKIATVAVGYADGLHRASSNRGRVFCQSFEAPIVGRVSMDMITIDVTDIPSHAARPGEWVDVIGPRHDVDAVATDAGTIGYEILTSLGRRFHRRYSGVGAE